MNFLDIWLSGFIVTMAFLTILWLISVRLKNASIIDPFWGTGFIILLLYYLYRVDIYTVTSLMVFIMVAIWGLRLSIFLFWRNRGKGEDFRYQQFREDYGPHRYWWVSFFQVFLLQGVLMSLVAVPLLGAVMPPITSEIGPLRGLAVLIWLIGLGFEAIGDYQLVRFKRHQKPGEVLDTGLWKYTRHPNYFGDAVVWWSFGLLAVANGYFLTLLGPLLMTVLLLKISGVSMLERTLKTTKPQYEDYIRRTPAFFPWFPKKH